MFRKSFAVAQAMIALAFIGFITFFICLPAANAYQEASVQVEGKIMATDPSPFIQDDRVLVPVRNLAGALGADVSWNNQQRAVTIAGGDYQITMLIGERHALVNGKDIQMEAAPVIVNGRAMVPLRTLAEGLQFSVSWDSSTKVASVSKLVLVAGSSLDFPPFEFKENDELVGFDMDLIRAIEEVSGEKITVQDVSFDGLIPSLRSGKIDLIISGLIINEPRKEVVAFTTPYFDYSQVIVNPKGGNTDISLADLAGKKIACQSGSFAHDLARGLEEKYPNTQIKTYESVEEVLAAIEKSEADAAVVDYPLTAYYITKHPESNLQMAGKISSDESLGIAVQMEDQELLEKLNKSLEKIIENGTYDRLYEKWFGSRP